TSASPEWDRGQCLRQLDGTFWVDPWFSGRRAVGWRKRLTPQMVGDLISPPKPVGGEPPHQRVATGGAHLDQRGEYRETARQHERNALRAACEMPLSAAQRPASRTKVAPPGSFRGEGDCWCTIYP